MTWKKIPKMLTWKDKIKVIVINNNKSQETGTKVISFSNTKNELVN